jgi:hypothetical protein
MRKSSVNLTGVSLGEAWPQTVGAARAETAAAEEEARK